MEKKRMNQLNIDLFFKALMEIIEEKENVKITYTIERRPKNENTN
jgi:hypothetical protein